MNPRYIILHRAEVTDQWERLPEIFDTHRAAEAIASTIYANEVTGTDSRFRTIRFQTRIVQCPVGFANATVT